MIIIIIIIYYLNNTYNCTVIIFFFSMRTSASKLLHPKGLSGCSAPFLSPLCFERSPRPGSDPRPPFPTPACLQLQVERLLKGVLAVSNEAPKRGMTCGAAGGEGDGRRKGPGRRVLRTKELRVLQRIAENGSERSKIS